MHEKVKIFLSAAQYSQTCKIFDKFTSVHHRNNYYKIIFRVYTLQLYLWISLSKIWEE